MGNKAYVVTQPAKPLSKSQAKEARKGLIAQLQEEPFWLKGPDAEKCADDIMQATSRA